MAKKRLGRPPRLRTALAGKISGDWLQSRSPGAQLPTVRQLAQQYKVSQVTVLAALDSLKSKWPLERTVGRGMYVAARQPHAVYAGKFVGVSLLRIGSGLRDSINLQTLNGIQEVLSEPSINILLKTRSPKRRMILGPAKHFSNPDLLGLLLVDQHSDSFLQSVNTLNKPVICIDFDGTSHGMDSICFDNVAAGAFLARRLYKLGHRRVAGLFEAPDKKPERRDPSWTERENGFSSEWKRLSGVPLIKVALPNRGQFRGAVSHVRTLLRLPASERPTAFVTPGVSFLESIAGFASELGLSVPADLTLMAFGVSSAHPLITGMNFNGQSLGVGAAERLLTLIAQKKGSMKSKASILHTKVDYQTGETHARAPERRD